MSDELGTHTFLPWLRRGISTQLGRVDDGSASSEPRSQVTVSVSVGPSTASAASTCTCAHAHSWSAWGSGAPLLVVTVAGRPSLVAGVIVSISSSRNTIRPSQGRSRSWGLARAGV